MRIHEKKVEKMLEYAVIRGDLETIKQVIEDVSRNPVDMLRLRSLYRTDSEAFLKEVKERLKNVTGRETGMDTYTLRTERL